MFRLVITSLLLVSMMLDYGMALTTRFSGDYFISNHTILNAGLNKADHTNQLGNMRFRLKTDFNLNQYLTFTTRLNALEKIWGSNDSVFAKGNNQENIELNHAYLVIKTDQFGMFIIGRQEGFKWGTDWSDNSRDTDRIKYILPLSIGENKLYLMAITEKAGEFDGTDTHLSNNDNDIWHLSGTYVTPSLRFGLLYNFYNFRKFQDPDQAIAAANFEKSSYGEFSETSLSAYNAGLESYQAAFIQDGQTHGDHVTTFLREHPQFESDYQLLGAPATNASGSIHDPMHTLSTRGGTAKAQVSLISPYFVWNINGFKLSAELDYIIGKTTYDTQKKDISVSAYSYFTECTYQQNHWTFQLGYGEQSGDADYTDDKIQSMGFMAPGSDFEKLFILSGSNANDTGTTHGLNTSLGNMGNHVGSGFTKASVNGQTLYTLLDGFRLLYGGLDYQFDKIKLGLLLGYANAHEVPFNVEKYQGIEVDLTFKWNIMDNLEYKAVAAYLEAGDYWADRRKISRDQLKDLYCFYHRLSVQF